jgi:O-antigen ligase
VRLLILRSAWAGLAEEPLFGVGYFNFEAYSRRDPEIRRSTGGVGYGTHNTYLEIFVEGGLLAFVPFLLHFVSSAGRFAHAWRAAMHGRDVTAAASLAGFLVVLTAAGVANVLLHFVFWSVCGLALACADRLESEARADEPAIARTAPSPA